MLSISFLKNFLSIISANTYASVHERYMHDLSYFTMWYITLDIGLSVFRNIRERVDVWRCKYGIGLLGLKDTRCAMCHVPCAPTNNFCTFIVRVPCAFSLTFKQPTKEMILTYVSYELYFEVIKNGT